MKTWVKGFWVGFLIAFIINALSFLTIIFYVVAAPFRLFFCNFFNCAELSHRDLSIYFSIFNIIIFSLVGLLIGWIIGKIKNK